MDSQNLGATIPVQRSETAKRILMRPPQFSDMLEPLKDRRRQSQTRWSDLDSSESEGECILVDCSVCRGVLECSGSDSGSTASIYLGSSSPPRLPPQSLGDGCATQGTMSGCHDHSSSPRRWGKGGSSGSLCAVRFLRPGNDSYSDEGVKSSLEKGLEVLDRLVESQLPPSSSTPRESSSELVIEGGSVFLQKIYDIFCEDRKVYVVHSCYERNLEDSAITTWFRLPGPFLESATSSTFHMDPDGTFQRQTERICQDVIRSLRFLAAELTLGLLFLHERGIVHQDIKPVNIMVTPLGHIQISDFGAASLLPRLLPGLPDLSDLGCTHPNGPLSPISEFGDFWEGLPCSSRKFGSLTVSPDETITFTPRYAAPELMEHNDEGFIVYDERVDWWSFGLVLCELAYGNECPDIGEIREQDEEEEGLCQFVHQLLVVDPRDRLGSTFVRDHRFLNFERQTWEEILELRHPPFPATIDLGIQLGAGDKMPYGSSTSMSLTAVQNPPVNVTNADPSPLVDRDPAPLSFEVGDQKSEIQPFPSTASLYRHCNSRRTCKSDREDVPRITASSEAINDSGLFSREIPRVLRDGGFEKDGGGGAYEGSGREGETLQKQNTECLLCSPVGPCELHGLGEDWVDMTLDEIVALSLLQARDSINTQLAEDWRRCKLRVKMRPKKVRIITKTSKRVVKIIWRYIYAALQCR